MAETAPEHLKDQQELKSRTYDNKGFDLYVYQKHNKSSKLRLVFTYYSLRLPCTLAYFYSLR